MLIAEREKVAHDPERLESQVLDHLHFLTGQISLHQRLVHNAKPLLEMPLDLRVFEYELVLSFIAELKQPAQVVHKEEQLVVFEAVADAELECSDYLLH